MKRFVASLLFFVTLLPAASAAEKPSRWRTVWRVSQGLLVAGNTADIASSWGKHEANPMLRTGNRFSYGSMAIKLGLLAGSLTAQHYFVRKHPEWTPYVTAGNLGTTAVMSVMAARNMSVPPSR